MNIVTYLHLHCEFHNFLFVRPNQQLAAKKRVVGVKQYVAFFAVNFLQLLHV